MRIAVTGHRPNKLDNDYDLKGLLVEHIRYKIVEILNKEIPEGDMSARLITGMALGIDTLFAQIAVDMKIPFIAAVPFKGQDRMWIDKSKIKYDYLLRQAQYIVVTDMNPIKPLEYNEFIALPETPFTAKKMQDRNEWMVDQCDVLIAVWDGSSGGTKNCVDYAYHAYHNTKQIYVINPRDIEREIIATEI